MLAQSLIVLAAATLAVASPLATVKAPRSLVAERAGESCTGSGAHWMWVRRLPSLACSRRALAAGR